MASQYAPLYPPQLQKQNHIDATRLLNIPTIAGRDFLLSRVEGSGMWKEGTQCHTTPTSCLPFQYKGYRPSLLPQLNISCCITSTHFDIAPPFLSHYSRLFFYYIIHKATSHPPPSLSLFTSSTSLRYRPIDPLLWCVAPSLFFILCSRNQKRFSPPIF